METAERFEVIYQDKPLVIQELSLSGRPMFVVPVAGNKPLVITTATGSEGQVFWTSIPEGRQALAESIGKLIEAHFQQNK